jgi:hypothetical protein
MTQSRLGSFVEAWINVFIGYTINFTANIILFPLFGWDITLKQNIILGCLYTVISVARSYCIRRWFNGCIHNAAQKLGG